jgi:hypothetical protein
MAWPVAAGVVLVLALVVLGGLLLVGRGDREPAAPVVAPAPTVLVLPTPSSAPTLVPAVQQAATRVPTLVSTAIPSTSTPLARATAVLASTPMPTAQASGGAQVVLANGTVQVLPAGVVVPSPTPGEWWDYQRPVEPPLAAEVEQAYYQFWEVRRQAWLDMDAAALGRAMGGVALQRDLAAMDQLRAQNRAQRIEITHHVSILHAAPDEAAVEDDYAWYVTNVHFESKEPVEPMTTGVWQLVYRLRKNEGVWKVVDSVRLID